MFHIIVRDNCQWCDKAKALLDERGLIYTTYNVGEGETDFRLFVRAAFKTVPQIWMDFNGEAHQIGDYEALRKYLAAFD
jgi:glutaredoxin